MPELALRMPWYGYPLGMWTEEDDAVAEAVAAGDYFFGRDSRKDPVKR
jgi:hypothetical protein